MQSTLTTLAGDDVTVSAGAAPAHAGEYPSRPSVATWPIGSIANTETRSPEAACSNDDHTPSCVTSSVLPGGDQRCRNTEFWYAMSSRLSKLPEPAGGAVRYDSQYGIPDRIARTRATFVEVYVMTEAEVSSGRMNQHLALGARALMLK